MFELETAMNEWRRQATATRRGDRAALAELEDHLREEFSALIRAGHSETEAWRMAAAKLGDPVSLGREFAKLDRLATVDRVALATLLGATALVIGGLGVFVLGGSDWARRPLLTSHVVAITLGYAAGLLAAAAAGYATIRALFVQSSMPALESAAMRVVQVASIAAGALTLLGIVLGASWAKAEWSRAFNAAPNEIGGICAMVGFAVAAVAASKRETPARVGLAIALGGGGIVLAAWFGAAALAGDHSAMLSVIGFGGLAATWGLALASLARRHHVTAG